jgi:hypothetical protein
MRRPGEAEMRRRNAWIAGAVVLLAAAVWAFPASAQDGAIQPGRYRPLGIAIDRLSGGVEGGSAPGGTATESFDFRGFREVSASHAFQVSIMRSDSYEVLVRIDRRLQPYLLVEMRGETLFIGLKPGRILPGRRETLEAEVRMPGLRGVQASGAAGIDVQGFTSSGDFRAELSGASRLEGEVRARSLWIEASGASNVHLRGKARELRLEASGASGLDLGSYPAEAEVEVSGLLHIKASGASRLYLGGNPTLGRIDLSGASTIERR